MSLLLGAICACQVAAAVPSAPPVERLTAAALVARARAARYQQDSSLAEYQAMARQRWTGTIGLASVANLGPVGRMRLALRMESVARVGWHHARGPWAELIAARVVVPLVGETEPSAEDDGEVLTLPYYPGRDVLWPTMELNGAFEDFLDGGKDWIEHPLAEGSDSLYHFSLGGPLAITLPGGKTIHLRELLLRPVRPNERLVVGSFWVDVSSGALVRAAYRPSVAIDFWPMMRENFDDDELSFVEKFGPFLGTAEEIVIEHGLYEERFWLPRVRLLHAVGTAKMGRVTVSMEQTFDYEKVRAVGPGAVVAAQDMGEPANGLYDTRDRVREWAQRAERSLPCRGSDERDPRFSPDSLSARRDLPWREWEGIKIRVFLPCDRDDLLNSKALPASIYAPGEELFTDTDLGKLRDEVSHAFAIDKQAEWEPQPTKLRYGLEPELWRYNRVEGLSAGAVATRQLGKGYELTGLARLGTADLVPNLEVTLRRASGHGDRRLALYSRLDAMNDWGSPFGMGASLSALLLGRDEGFYHRTLGAEVGGTYSRVSGGPSLAWRLFAEQHSTADVGTSFSFGRMLAGTDFLPNVAVPRREYVGAAAALGFALGDDPRGVQLSGSLRAEVADGGTRYGRGFTEFRLASGLPGGALGAITAAAGSSLWDPPPERLYYLGGAHTIHAHRAGARSGNSFWMGRAELTKGFPMIRPIIFADLGWASDRSELMTTRDRLWAAGVGAAALDGLVRFDVSRAMDASRRWQVDLFIEIR